MFDGIGGLSTSELQTVSSALRAGRLTVPFSSISLGRLLPEPAASDVLVFLTSMADRGMAVGYIASAIDLVVVDRLSRARQDVDITLVTTGMGDPGGVVVDAASGARDTRVVVQELFAHATISVLIVGYAVHQGRQIFQALADRMAVVPNLQVELFLDVKRSRGDTTRESDLVTRFAADFWSRQWPTDRPRPDVYYYLAAIALDAERRPAMHAKCIIVDAHTVFISSANFTSAAQQRNVEVGMLVRSVTHAVQLHSQFRRLAAVGRFERLA
jgi:phosphatidylserine/phosphatidylglycerophosphate/cardiolipin synthase-like enzyme